MTRLARFARPAREKSPTWRRTDIQGLRAVAVILVVAYHAGLPVPGGFVGVDIFFAISGFVITQLVLRSHASRTGFRLRTFYARRMKRLLPALALMLSITTLVAVFLESPFGQQQVTALTSVGTSLFVANFVIEANTGGYFDAPAALNPLLHTWSLSVEEQFYFVFPSLMAGAWWLARRRNTREAIGHHANGRAIAAVVLIALTIVSFVLGARMSIDAMTVPGVEDPVAWAYYSSITRAWEFAIGALLALAVAHWPHRIGKQAGQALTLIGAALVIAGAFVIDATMPFPGTIALLPVIGTLLVIAGGEPGESARAPVITRTLGLPGMVWIGALSYSWYLWHWPVIVFTESLAPGNATLLLVAGLGSLLPAWLAYRYVEHPIHRSSRIEGKRVVALIAVSIGVPVLLAFGLRTGANAQWGNPTIDAMAAQIVPLPVSYQRGCDNGVPLGQQQNLDCTWNAQAPGAPVYLVGDSEAGQLAEGIIGAGEILGRPVTIADMNSCPFVLTTTDEAPLQADDCQAFVQQTTDWLADPRTPGTVVIAVSPNYVTPENREAFERALARSITTLEQAGHGVVLLQAFPQFLGWGPWSCSLIDTLINADGCGQSVPRSTMDDRQVLALEMFDRVSQQTNATLLDLRDELCANGACATNIGDTWQFRDAFHITVRQSQAFSLQLAGAVSPS